MTPTMPNGMPMLPPSMVAGPTDTLTMLVQLVMDMVPVMFALVYLSPVIVAILRKNPAAGTVFLINLFLGWTVIGWFVALAWSYVGGGQQAIVVASTATAGGAPVSTLVPAPTKWWHVAVKIIGGFILFAMLIGFYLIFTSPVSPDMQRAVSGAQKATEQKPVLPQGVPQNAEELFGQ